MHHSGWSITSAGSAVAAVLVHWSPVLQAMAALVAVVAGSISIYKSLKKKE